METVGDVLARLRERFDLLRALQLRLRSSASKERKALLRRQIEGVERQIGDMCALKLAEEAPAITLASA